MINAEPFFFLFFNLNFKYSRKRLLFFQKPWENVAQIWLFFREQRRDKILYFLLLFMIVVVIVKKKDISVYLNLLL